MKKKFKYLLWSFFLSILFTFSLYNLFNSEIRVINYVISLSFYFLMAIIFYRLLKNRATAFFITFLPLLLLDLTVFIDGISLIPLRCHTSWRLESEGKQLIVTGDICNHAVLSMQKPRWHVLFDMDKQQAVDTRIRMLDMLAADQIPMVGYHMPFPSIGFVEKQRRDGGHYHWHAASYQFTM